MVITTDKSLTVQHNEIDMKRCDGCVFCILDVQIRKG